MHLRNLLGSFALLFLVIECDRLFAASTNTVPIAVLIGITNGEAQYELDRKPVPSEKLLEALSQAKREREKGRETPIVVLIDKRNSIAALSNIRGIIDKAGFSNVRYFYLSADRERMAEVALDRPAIPFSLNPPPANR